MSTRSTIILQNTDGQWAHIYCHYDGTPGYMLPALNAHACKAIADAREIRSINPDRIDAFSNPRMPEVSTLATFPEWAEHAYILTANGWQHAKDQDQLDALAEQATA